MAKKSPDLPCASCPWRIGQDASNIPRYSRELACGLMCCVGKGDAFRPIMACHGSSDNQMRACNGYLAREGWSNLNVRLLLMQGQIANPDHVLDSCKAAGIELHLNYAEVLAKLEET